MQTRNRLVVTRACVHIFSISDQRLTFRRRSCKVYVLYRFSEIFRILLPKHCVTKIQMCSEQCSVTFSTFSKSLRTVPEEEAAVVVGGPTGTGSTTTSAASLSWLMEGELVKFVLADGGWDTSLTLSWLVEGEISNMVSIEHTLYLKISNIAKRILWRARLILPVGRASFIVSHVYTCS